MTEYEAFVWRIRHDADWTGQDPSPGSTLAEFIEDHRVLVTFMDYGGRKRWDGFHVLSHPAPSLSEPGDFAADQILMKRRSKSPREIGSYSDFPSKKRPDTFDGVPRKQRLRQSRRLTTRRKKKIFRRSVVYNEPQASVAKYVGCSRTTVRRDLQANAPEIIESQKAQRAAMLRQNSKWRWLVDIVSQAPHEATFECVNAPAEAVRLRPYLRGMKETRLLKWSVRCLSKTTVQVRGSIAEVKAGRIGPWERGE